jgi:hypothetical protein
VDNENKKELKKEFLSFPPPPSNKCLQFIFPTEKRKEFAFLDKKRRYQT